MGNHKTERGRRAGKIAVSVSLFAAAAVFGVLAYMEGSEFSEAQGVYDALAEEYVSAVSEDTGSADADDKSTSQPAGGILSIDWKGLLAQNTDVVGWIQMDPGISYPIMHGGNNTYYSNHDFYGRKRKTGSIFMSCANESLFDKHVVIYGHNTATGTMFGNLRKYKSEEYAASHKLVRIYYPGGTYANYIIIGAFVRISKSSDVFETITDDAETFSEYKAKWESKTTYTLRDWEDASRIISLSTCFGASGTSKRIVVMLAPASDYEKGGGI